MGAINPGPGGPRAGPERGGSPAGGRQNPGERGEGHRSCPGQILTDAEIQELLERIREESFFRRLPKEPYLVEFPFPRLPLLPVQVIAPAVE